MSYFVDSVSNALIMVITDSLAFIHKYCAQITVVPEFFIGDLLGQVVIDSRRVCWPRKALGDDGLVRDDGLG
ncbi:hypothetical protein BCT45_05325 [Vibrio breoganii]|nr:hypothetical protein BCT45_05325 [Vibrio breoganii]